MTGCFAGTAPAREAFHQRQSQERRRGIRSATARTAGFPHDAADLRRCVLLLREVPEAFEHGVLVLAAKYDNWAALAANWTHLERTLTGEAGADLNRRVMTPRTYRLIRSLLDRVEAA